MKLIPNFPGNDNLILQYALKIAHQFLEGVETHRKSASILFLTRMLQVNQKFSELIQSYSVLHFSFLKLKQKLRSVDRNILIDIVEMTGADEVREVETLAEIALALKPNKNTSYQRAREGSS